MTEFSLAGEYALGALVDAKSASSPKRMVAEQV